MPRTLRRLGLSLHLVLSLGWLGALASFLALALASSSPDPLLSRAAFLMMDVVGRSALLPLSVGALVSGIVQSLGTRWGVFRYYWVAAKLGLTLFATLALFVHQATAITEAAQLAAHASATLLRSGRVPQLGRQLLADASLALVVLLAITLIAVYKPWGAIGRVTRGLRLFWASLVALLVGFLALHLTGHSPHRHP